MVTRFRCRFLPPALLFVLSFATAACQKVPLLAPTGSTITLTAAATALPANGTTDIIAQVIEASGTPPQDGTLITFLTTLGSLEPSEAHTHGGRVTVKFRAGSSNGTATITASSGGATVPANGAVKILIGAAAVGGLSVNANPTVVPALGGSSTITATVLDASGNLLSSIPVTFTTDQGSVAPSLATTDANGKAQTTLTTTRTAKVTATAGVPSGTGSTAVAASTASVTVSVNATQTVTVGTITPAAPTVGQTVSLPLSYSSTAGLTPVAKLTVNWGDGVVDTFNGQPGAISHAYFRAGSYVVHIVATDATGDTSQTLATVTIAPQAKPTVTISASASPQPNSTVTFTITAAPTAGNSIQSISVDFGDGSQQTLQGNASSVQHVYSSAGTYTVTATATDTSGSTGSGSTVIVVGGASTASYTISPSPTKVGQTTSFNGSDSTSASPITNYAFDFGDGTGASGSSPQQTKIYAVAGSYTTRLTITDSAGRTATKTVALTVNP